MNQSNFGGRAKKISVTHKQRSSKRVDKSAKLKKISEIKIIKYSLKLGIIELPFSCQEFMENNPKNNLLQNLTGV